MKRFCFALDLVDDPQSMLAYEEHHLAVWPEVLASIREAGIISMEIYRVSNRLFMVMDTDDEFDFECKAERDLANPKVMEWEQLMWKYQQALPTALPGQKWMLMNPIFKFNA